MEDNELNGKDELNRKEEVVANQVDVGAPRITEERIQHVKDPTSREFWRRYVGSQMLMEAIVWKCVKCDAFVETDERDHKCPLCRIGRLARLCRDCWEWKATKAHKCGTETHDDFPEGYGAGGLTPLIESRAQVVRKEEARELANKRRGGHQGSPLSHKRKRDSRGVEGRRETPHRKVKKINSDGVASEATTSKNEFVVTDYVTHEEQKSRVLELFKLQENHEKSLRDIMEEVEGWSIEEAIRRRDAQKRKEKMENVDGVRINEKKLELLRAKRARPAWMYRADEVDRTSRIAESEFGHHLVEAMNQSGHTYYGFCATVVTPVAAENEIIIHRSSAIADSLRYAGDDKRYMLRSAEDWKDIVQNAIVERIVEIQARQVILFLDLGEREGGVFIVGTGRGKIVIEDSEVIDWIHGMHRVTPIDACVLQFAEGYDVAKTLSEVCPGMAVVASFRNPDPHGWCVLKHQLSHHLLYRQQPYRVAHIDKVLMRHCSALDIVKKGLVVLRDGENLLTPAYAWMSSIGPNNNGLKKGTSSPFEVDADDAERYQALFHEKVKRVHLALGLETIREPRQLKLSGEEEGRATSIVKGLENNDDHDVVEAMMGLAADEES